MDQTDTLVVIDSTVLKPAFGYTGMELGYFIRVMERDSGIRSFRDGIKLTEHSVTPEIEKKS